MNNNNKKPSNLTSKDKNESETRVFARLMSHAETQEVSGAFLDGKYSPPVCKKTKNGDTVRMDCTYYPQ